MNVILLFISVLLLSTQHVAAQTNVTRESLSIVDEKALTINGNFGAAINGKSFQQDVMITHLGYQYLSYYDAARHVCIARRKLPNGNWDIIRFMDYDFKSNDAHNVISMGISPNDGTIHLAFDHHGHELHYRVSTVGLANEPKGMQWNSAAFGPVVSELETDKRIKITYPRFWQSPKGDLQFCYRRGGSGNGDRMLVDYNSKTGQWENTRQIDSGDGLFADELGQSDSRCSYPNGYNYDDRGTLHATWVWRESSQGANHDLVYVFSEDQGITWKNNEGEQLDQIPFVNSPGIAVQEIPRVLGLMNTHGQTIDSKGRVHVVMYHCTKKSILEAGSTPGDLRWGPEEAKRYHHYWRSANGEWRHFQMDFKVGNRPKVFADENDNLVMIYGGQVSQNSREPEENAERGLVIAVATAKNQWTDWHIAHEEKGPFVNEMLGDYYRWKSEGLLSIIVQDLPKAIKAPSTLKVIDYSFKF